MRVTLTLEIANDAHCPHCLALLGIDERDIEVYIGECIECGTDLILEPTVEIEWSIEQ